MAHEDDMSRLVGTYPHTRARARTHTHTPHPTHRLNTLLPNPLDSSVIGYHGQSADRNDRYDQRDAKAQVNASAKRRLIVGIVGYMQYLVLVFGRGYFGQRRLIDWSKAFGCGE